MTRSEPSADAVEAAALSNGNQYDAHDFTAIGDAARSIASWCEGPARRNVYKAAKECIAALTAAQPHSAASEREAIVAWLRKTAEEVAYNPNWGDYALLDGQCHNLLEPVRQAGATGGDL